MNDRRSFGRLLAGTTATAAIAAGLCAPAGAAAVPTDQARHAATTVASGPAPAARRDTWEPRPEQYAGTVTTTDIPIEMDDGVTLRADLTLPADADGEAVDRPLPVLVTITAYNKTVLANGGGSVLNGGEPDYLVKRGYAELVVDARGTGSSEGVWQTFSARENEDAGAVVEWAHRQPWSNGKVGMTGPSYMGISQIFAAGQRPAGLKAIFPQVPAADVYRDVVASGGQIDVGFIPLWMGLVTGTGLVPPAFGLSEPQNGLQWVLDRLLTATTFTGPVMLEAILGGEPAYDGPFYRERSPIEVIDRVDVPTFLVGGQRDLFQRGTPLLFERLQQNGVPTKFVFGPWDHLEGSSGAAIGDAGHGSLPELQLRWFDHWMKGRNGRLGQIAPMTYYEQGTDRWRIAPSWVADDLSARSYALSGSAAMGGKAGRLTVGRPTSGQSVLQPLPVTGLCTRSTNQWTAGILNMLWADNPCFQDNSLNDLGALVFETRPVRRAVRFQGPINARLHVSTPSGDGMLAVIVEDVAPDGTVTHVTGGWQVIAHRALDRSRSRYLDGQLIQPFHPFTQAAKAGLPAGEIAPVDVEVFPTAAAIRKGHRLRISVQGYDVPHLLPTLPDLLGQTVPITVHTGPGQRSVLTLPVR